MPPTHSSLPVHDRKRELAELERAWRSGKPELLLALGRRRAGKSYLLRRFLEGRAGFYYQATKTTAREQLRALGEAAAAEAPQSGLRYGSGFRSWDAFFEYIIERSAGRPFALILDEMPYLLEAVRGFGTILQKQWDNALQGSRVKLILSGSYISAMTRLTAADQPLHGRRTGRLHFAPFNYLDAAAFVPAYSAVDRLLAYGIFGGLPGQLAVIDPARPLAENVADHLLNPAGRLADEAEHLLDAFTREGGVHYSLIRAIAGGEHRWSRITSRVGKDSASVSRPLEWLQQMELVTKIIPVTDTPPGNPKKSLYRLADPYLAFWHRYVAPLRATGAVEVLTPTQLWQRYVSPHLSEYMGPVFEHVCRTFVSRGSHPSLPFLPDRVGEWWSDDHQDQIDVVALGPEGEVLLGECKWGNAAHQDLELLQRRGDLIARELRGIRHVHLALFTSSPTIKDRKLAERIQQGDVLHLSAAELMQSG